MNRLLKKLLLLILIFTFFLSPSTNSFFSDTETSASNTFSAGCWAPPSTPQLLSPANNYLANQSSSWYQNPVMDWTDSSFVCPGLSVKYQYESFHDPTLSILAYRSGWLTNSFIPAPGTPDGVYYWHVRACNSDDLTNCSEWSDTWKLTVDTTAPIAPTNLHWTNPDVSCGGSTNSTTITADWNDVFDTSGISQYEYQITYPKLDGTIGIWNTFVTASQYFGVFNQGQGLHTYKVRAYDFSGNISPWSSGCSINFDSVIPQSIITVPVVESLPNTDNEIDQIYLWDGKIEGTATDSGSGLNRVELNIYRPDVQKSWNGSDWILDLNQNIRVNADGTNNWHYEITDPIPAGVYKLTSHAVDNAGNIENSYVVEFENIDQDPNAPLSADLFYNSLQNKIYLTLSSIDTSTIPLNYDLIYTSANLEKGIAGSINIADITNNSYTNNFYLGTCSAGVCTPDPDLTSAQFILTDSLKNNILIDSKINLIP